MLLAFTNRNGYSIVAGLPIPLPIVERFSGERGILYFTGHGLDPVLTENLKTDAH